jgi:hypothetical protein
MGEDLHQHQQRGEPHLVILAGDAFLQVLQAGLPPACLYHLPGHGNFDAEELVALAVLSRPGLEETGEPGHLAFIGPGGDFFEKCVHLIASRHFETKILFFVRNVKLFPKMRV